MQEYQETRPSLDEREMVMKERGDNLVFCASSNGLRVLITYLGPKIHPPFLVQIFCHGKESYGVLFWNLPEVARELPFDLDRFEFVKESEERS